MKNTALATLFLLLASCSSSTQTTSTTSAPAPAPAAKAPDEAAALKIVKDTVNAETDYFKRNRRYALTYEELVDAHLMMEEPSTTATGYEFKLRPAANAQSYKLLANPANPSPTTKFFFTDQKGEIKAEQGKEATADSPNVSGEIR